MIHRLLDVVGPQYDWGCHWWSAVCKMLLVHMMIEVGGGGPQYD